jgi:hypothetical protein
VRQIAAVNPNGVTARSGRSKWGSAQTIATTTHNSAQVDQRTGVNHATKCRTGPDELTI